MRSELALGSATSLLCWSQRRKFWHAPPCRGQPGWDEYAPYDLGSRWRCLVGFVRSARGCGGSVVGVGVRQGDKAV